MMRTSKNAACQLASGCYKNSPTFVKRTSFKSETHFLSHLSNNLPTGMTMNDYGKKDGWEVEHAIPVQAYDLSNPEDIKRCWSPANVRGLAPAKNYAKGYTLIDSLCLEVGVDAFPIS